MSVYMSISPYTTHKHFVSVHEKFNFGNTDTTHKKWYRLALEGNTGGAQVSRRATCNKHMYMFMYNVMYIATVYSIIITGKFSVVVSLGVM